MKARALLALALVAVAAPLEAQRIAEISVAPPLLRLRPGAQVHVLATAYDREGLPVDARLHWTSSNINVATVDSLGRVYAVAPGIAIITAASDTVDRRRRYGRSTVFVSTSATWGPGPKVMVAGDTVPPEECSDPSFALRNPGRVCWDVRPTQRAGTTLAPPASCEDRAAPVVYQVLVGPDGRVQQRVRLGRPTCQDYEELAAEMLDEVCCNPAWRNGHAVTAWTILTIRPPYQPRVHVTVPTPAVPPVPRPGTPPPAPDKQGPRPD